jgi:hypothetical protein
MVTYVYLFCVALALLSLYDSAVHGTFPIGVVIALLVAAAQTFVIQHYAKKHRKRNLAERGEAGE